MRYYITWGEIIEKMGLPDSKELMLEINLKIGFCMLKVFCTDLSEKMVFDRLVYHYQNIYFDDRLHLGIWRMTLKEDGKFLGYEVVKGVRYKQPDGSIVYFYPGDEDFGVHGFYSYDLGWCLDKINWWSDVE